MVQYGLSIGCASLRVFGSLVYEGRGKVFPNINI